MQNWRNYYEKLYSQSQVEEVEEIKEEIEINTALKSKKKAEELDREFTREEMVDALFALKSKTAAGNDLILNKDLVVLLETHIKAENWKNIEILNFLQRMMQSLWGEEKVPETFKEIILRPFLKSADKDPTKPSNYRPVALLNVLMKIYEHIIGVRLIAFLERKKYLSNKQAAYRKGR